MSRSIRNDPEAEREGFFAPPPPSDPVELFRQLVDSRARGDWRVGQVVTRELRAAGYSVCFVQPLETREGRRC